jgi:isoleucyl-tRNA synthetase
MFRVLEATLRLMAPILPFTSDEAWEAMPAFQSKEDSVHLAYFPEGGQAWLASDFMKKIDRLLEVRELALKEMERAREARLIGNSLEARLELQAPDELFDLLDEFREDLTMIFIVSEVVFELAEGKELSVTVARAGGHKCQRCWNFSTSVGQDPDYPEVCARCSLILKTELNLR